jgi:PleD family two-component response regulator
VEIVHDGTRIPVEYSYGSVGYEPGETPERFLERADQLLYADKRRSKKAAPQLSYTER